MEGYIDSFDLFNIYLKTCTKKSEFLLTQAKNKSLSVEDSKLAKELSHLASVLCAIYLFRQDSDLTTALNKIPINQRKSMEEALKITWKHLLKLNSSEISEVAIDVIQLSSEIFEKINHLKTYQ